MRILIFGTLVGAMVLGAWVYVSLGRSAGDQGQGQPVDGTMVVVNLPDLSGAAAEGAQAFDRLCAGCHGANAGGLVGKGPPLIHKIYEPGHHGDAAFVRAARQGVRGHHWPFGDMPPVAGATDADIRAIIAYIRAVQRENGIF